MALWTPAEITTALWLDADDSSTITLNGTNAAEVGDKSGNDFHAVAPTSGAQPALIDAELNGLPVLRFNGSGHYLRNQTAQLLQNNATQFTAFLVLKTSETNSRFAFLYGDDSRRQIVFQRFSGSDLLYASTGNVDYAQVSQDTGWQVLALRYDGSGSNNAERLHVFRNGTQLTPAFFGTIPANLGALTHGFFVGARSNLSAFMAMDFAELVIAPTALQSDVVNLVFGSLHHKWGLAGNLPADDPYKSAPPTIIAGNARFRESTPARLVIALERTGVEIGRDTPDPASTPPGDYETIGSGPMLLLQAHAFDPEDWQGIWTADTEYQEGDIVFSNGDTNDDSLVLECTAATGSQQSGATEPTWDATVGETTVDNDLTWTTLGTVAELAPITNYYVAE